MAWLHDILHNTYFIWCAMAIIIFGVTQVLKLPIKCLTKKIKNERLRKIVNSVILLIPFALGVLFDFLYSTYYLKEGIYQLSSIINGLGYGTAGISLYGVIERFFKVKANNPYDTEEGKAISQLISDVTGDGKIDSNDISAVQDFLNKVSK